MADIKLADVAPCAKRNERLTLEHTSGGAEKMQRHRPIQSVSPKARICLLILSCFAAALTTSVTAESLVPSKTRTITIRSQPAADDSAQPLPPTASFKLLTIKPIQPQSENSSEAAGGRRSDEMKSGNISSEGLQKIRTVRVRPAPGVLEDGYRHLVPKTPAPAGSVSE
ncbi:hypothetical protein ACQR1I_32080 [Bradyrhizobium sp. HKCCYLS2038]|uniref:hypothetical protein n=1 Tax=unclassified Bradyrhizobium TaxID=2631580 RepID=UPI003EB71817